MTIATDSRQVVVRLRTLGPSGLNPPQIQVVERLQTLAEDGSIDELDVNCWGASIGITQTAERDPVGRRDRIPEFKQWADERNYTLRPAFDWRATESADTEQKPSGEIVTPLITLAVYTGDHLQAVYPHVDGENVCTVHDGVEALESIAGPEDTEQSPDEQSEDEPLAVPLQ